MYDYIFNDPFCDLCPFCDMDILKRGENTFKEYQIVTISVGRAIKPTIERANLQMWTSGQVNKRASEQASKRIREQENKRSSEQVNKQLYGRANVGWNELQWTSPSSR